MGVKKGQGLLGVLPRQIFLAVGQISVGQAIFRVGRVRISKQVQLKNLDCCFGFTGTQMILRDDADANFWPQLGFGIFLACVQQLPPGLFDSAERAHDIHGGEVETSLMLHLAPQLVRKEALADFKGLPHELAARNSVLGAEKPVGIAWNAEDLHPSGACGNATRADASKGARHLAHLADRLATLVAELAATPLATLK